KGRERAHRTGRAPGRRGEREPGTAPTLGHPGRYGTVRAPISYILRGAVETVVSEHNRRLHREQAVPPRIVLGDAALFPQQPQRAPDLEPGVGRFDDGVDV